MILRLSQKLAKKIKTTPTRVLPLDGNPLADWSAHLFVADRAHYILLSNTASLYSAVIHGRGVTCENALLKRGLDQIRELMNDDGLGFFYRRFVAPATATVRFSKALDRSVIGSMNELVFHAKFWLTERDASPYDASFHLNEIPMSPHGYANPREALKSLELSPADVP